MNRVLGLDAFRGFVILSMIFVNYIAGMESIPAMLEHAKGGVDHFTFADLVFPAFLLMVGVSIPLALHKRVTNSEKLRKTLGHLFSRTAALLVMGVVLADPWAYDAAATGMPPYLWFPLFYLSAALFLFDGTPFLWMQNPKWRGVVRGAGLVGAALLLALVRLNYQDGEGAVPLRTSWWGILGMIGWCYLPNALIWNSAARQRCRMRLECSLLDLLVAVFALQVGFYTAWHAGAFPFIDNSFLHFPLLFGSHAALVSAGMIAGQMLLENENRRRVFRNWAIFAVILYGLGLLLRNWQIANKIDGTASWTLMTGGISLFGLTLFSLVMEGRGKKWLHWLVPIGANAMLVYLLPDFFGKLMDATALWLAPALGGSKDSLFNLWNVFWPFWAKGGMLGLANALVMTLLVGGIASWLNKRNVRLKL